MKVIRGTLHVYDAGLQLQFTGRLIKLLIILSCLTVKKFRPQKLRPVCELCSPPNQNDCKSDSSAETKKRQNHDHICRFYCCQIMSSDRRKCRKEAIHILVGARVIARRGRQCLVSVSGRVICKSWLLANGISIEKRRSDLPLGLTTRPRPFLAPLYIVSMMSINSCLSSSTQFNLLLFPVPKSHIICLLR